MLELLRFDAYKRLNPNELTIQQLVKLEKEIRHPIPREITDEYYDFKLWNLGLPSRQERFAIFLSKKLPKTDGLRVLEVGGGRTARLSRMLSERGFKMTCIDPQIEKVHCDGIEVIKGKFDYTKIDLSSYDYIVAQEPCDATEHIVRACIEQRKPFLISLCGVPHKLISGQKPKTYKDWYEYLRNISPNEIRLGYFELDPIGLTPLLRSNYS